MGGARPPNVILVHFKQKFAPLIAQWGISSRVCPLKESVRDVTVTDCPSRKRFGAHNLVAVEGKL